MFSGASNFAVVAAGAATVTVGGLGLEWLSLVLALPGGRADHLGSLCQSKRGPNGLLFHVSREQTTRSRTRVSLLLLQSVLLDDERLRDRAGGSSHANFDQLL